MVFFLSRLLALAKLRWHLILRGSSSAIKLTNLFQVTPHSLGERGRDEKNVWHRCTEDQIVARPA